MNPAKYFEVRLGLLFAGISFVCSVLLYTVPDLTIKIIGYLTHSELNLAIKPFEPVGFLAGLVLWFIIGTAIGFAYSKLCGCCREK